MKCKIYLSVIMFFLLYCGSALALIKATTSIQDEVCIKIKEDKYTGVAEFRCAGINNYSLRVLYDDNRMSLDVVTPDNLRHPLELWDKVTHSFYYIENDIEWRLKRGGAKKIPMSMIITVRSNSIDNAPERWRVTIGLGKGLNCITGIYDSSLFSVKQVRHFSDDMFNQHCLAF
ncbi:hypothetical protein ACM92B_002029 [Cronobacter dublinensis]|uniref:hypothetical protein n=1 Tax=Cronobacter dublinensis TaxID=413497 RepID=UPI000CFD914B|nr:hypothetical protein [Cronobacter dublinensis]